MATAPARSASCLQELKDEIAHHRQDRGGDRHDGGKQSEEPELMALQPHACRSRFLTAGIAHNV
jgi:hypothetical protein